MLETKSQPINNKRVCGIQQTKEANVVQNFIRDKQVEILPVFCYRSQKGSKHEGSNSH